MFISACKIYYNFFESSKTESFQYIYMHMSCYKRIIDGSVWFCNCRDVMYAFKITNNSLNLVL